MRIVGRADTRGFTLVEVLIAMVILGIGILGVTILFPRALRDTQVASGTTVARTYADSMVDRLRARGYDGMRGEADPFGRTAHDEGRRWDGAVPSLLQLRASDLLYSETDIRLVDNLVLYDPIRNVNQSLQLYQVVVTVPLTVGPKEQFITFIARQ